MKPKRTTFKGISLFIGICFFVQAIFPSFSFSQELLLPKPDQFVNLSGSYSFPVLKGMKFAPREPLKMEFIIDSGDQKEVTKEEASQLIRYFLCGLTIPEEDIWVNLSSYEEDRITTPKLAETDLGRDLLAQDYILKQLSSSLVYPESDTGKDYWQKVYREVRRIANTTKVPVDTFNKIWITPDEAEVYEDQAQGLCLITKASLKVMLEEDFLALSKQKTQLSKEPKSSLLHQEIHRTASQVMRQTILPQIAQDVNYGKNFANLRQIYHSLILAVWFKRRFKESLYKHYINKEKIKGVDLEDKSIKEKIYNTYLEAFSKGLYNYIKTESEPVTKKRIKRRYFSGGIADFTLQGMKVTHNRPSFPSGLESLVEEFTIETAPFGNLAGSPITISLPKPENRLKILRKEPHVIVYADDQLTIYSSSTGEVVSNRTVPYLTFPQFDLKIAGEHPPLDITGEDSLEGTGASKGAEISSTYRVVEHEVKDDRAELTVYKLFPGGYEKKILGPFDPREDFIEERKEGIKYTFPYKQYEMYSYEITDYHLIVRDMPIEGSGIGPRVNIYDLSSPSPRESIIKQLPTSFIRPLEISNGVRLREVRVGEKEKQLIIEIPEIPKTAASAITTKAPYGGIALDGINPNLGQPLSSIDFGDIDFKALEELLENSGGIDFEIKERESTTLGNFLGAFTAPKPQKIPSPQ